MLSVKQQVVNTSFKVTDFTRIEVKPESTAQEADALTMAGLMISEAWGYLVVRGLICCSQ